MTVLWMFLAGLIALGYARSIIIWSFLGYAVGWPAAVLVLFLGVKTKRWEERLKALEQLRDKAEEVANKIQDKEKPEGYKEFNNVHDLFKQLDKK
jgi:uncharacterized membrane protein YgaE (UPF0421/DUF939 family)